MKKMKMPKPKYLDAENLFENAMGYARKEAGKISGIRNKNKLIYAKEKARIGFMADYLTGKLDLYINSFPVVSQLNEFQKESLDSLIELKTFRKELGYLFKLNTVIKNLKKNNLASIRKSDKPEKVRKTFYGRVLSLKKDVVRTVNFLNETGRKLKEIPEIQFMPSVIVAGFPNSGKTTILKRLTGSEPRIASYPFTTQKIELGYFTEKYKDFQIIDTPGLLDRKEEERNLIERKAVNALKNLDGIILFVVDLSEESYSLQEQKSLLKELEKLGKKIVVALNKEDLAAEEQKEKGKKEFNEFECIFTGENDNSLKEKLIEKMN
ncbi:MAG: GTPase [Candidatus Micrarchaeota archaeon]|nr:50S ribosome-binding GTPase [Candidatus Micrarchaeota archaeon]